MFSRRRSSDLSLNGFCRNKNPGGSNRKGGEIPPGLKDKVFWRTIIVPELVVPKRMPNWYQLEG